MKKTIAILLISIVSGSLSAQTNNGARAKKIINKMTLEEKAKLVVGNGFKLPGVNPQGPVIGTTQDKIAGAAGTTYSNEQLGIPSMVLSDGPAGVRIDSVRNNDHSKTYYATAWPTATLL